MEGKNEAAKGNTIAKLLTIGELEAQFKQEVTIKNGVTDLNNYILELLKQKKEEQWFIPSYFLVIWCHNLMINDTEGISECGIYIETNRKSKRQVGNI